MTELIMIEIFVDVPEPRCHLGPGSQTRASVKVPTWAGTNSDSDIAHWQPPSLQGIAMSL